LACARFVTLWTVVPAGRTSIVNSMPNWAETRMSVSMLGLHLAELQASHLGLLHAEALGKLTLREVVIGAISDDGDRHRTCKRRPLPLSAKLRVGAELLCDQLVVWSSSRSAS